MVAGLFAEFVSQHHGGERSVMVALLIRILGGIALVVAGIVLFVDAFQGAPLIGALLEVRYPVGGIIAAGIASAACLFSGFFCILVRGPAVE